MNSTSPSARSMSSRSARVRKRRVLRDSAVRGRERVHRRRGAARADDRTILEQRAGLGAQRVEAGGDEALQRCRHPAGFEVGERIGLRGGRLAQHRGELLHEERVAAACARAARRRAGDRRRRRATPPASRVHRLLVERVDADDSEVAAAGVDRSVEAQRRAVRYSRRGTAGCGAGSAGARAGATRARRPTAARTTAARAAACGRCPARGCGTTARNRRARAWGRRRRARPREPRR